MEKKSTSASKQQNEKPKVFKLLIKTNIHDQIWINALSTDTIEILKARVADAKNIDDTQKFDLNLRGRLLNDNNGLIVDFKIKDNSVIDLKLKHISGGLVLVKRRDNGQVFTIEYKNTDKMKAIKEKIFKLFEIPIKSQHLSARVLNLKKNSEYFLNLDDEAHVFRVTSRCRNQVLLDIGE